MAKATTNKQKAKDDKLSTDELYALVSSIASDVPRGTQWSHKEDKTLYQVMDVELRVEGDGYLVTSISYFSLDHPRIIFNRTADYFIDRFEPAF